MSFKNLTASIWGAGGIAQTHARALSELGIRVKVVYDINIKNAEYVASLCGAEVATSDEAEIFKYKVNVIHLCTPANLHFSQLKKLIGAGFNIFCEKPLTLNNEEASELSSKVVENKIISGIGFNIRYHESIDQAKQIIAGEDFGPIRLIFGSYLQEFNAFPAPLDWRYNTETAGKMRAVTEIGSHWFDLVQYLTGSRIVKVSAIFSKFSPKRKLKEGFMYSIEEDGEVINIESEDAAIINCEFENGTLGNCVLSEASPGRVNKLSVEITGEKKNIWWDSEELNKLHLGEKNKGVNTLVNPFGGGFSDTHRKMFTDFYADVLSGYNESSKKYPTFEDGAYNVILCNGVYESAINNSVWIDLRKKISKP